MALFDKRPPFKEAVKASLSKHMHDIDIIITYKRQYNPPILELSKDEVSTIISL